MDLSITNVINISVSQVQQGLSAFNTSNIAIFTRDVAAMSFGSLGYQIYLSPQQVGIDFGTSSATYKMAVAAFSQSPNLLSGSGYLVVIPMLTSPSAEALNAAIVRTESLVQYFGVMIAEIPTQVDMLAAAATIQSLNKIAFFVSITVADLSPGGMLDLLRSGSFTQSRGLYYGGILADALDYMAAYASRAMSVDFSGSNTTNTIHLKALATIQPDPTMTQAYLALAQTAGVDCYVSIQGDPVVFSSGKNGFFDSIYNAQWFVGALNVAMFNYLSQSSTKIPQTESGMDGFKSAMRSVCTQAVANAYVAPGAWTSSTTFGNPVDLISNIAQVGYYLYSSPIAQQLQADRAARKAPLCQLAIKEAGAIHSSSLIIYINQ
jgi:hypothetical protein